MNLADFILTVSFSTTFGFILGYFFKALVAKIHQQRMNKKLTYFEKHKSKGSAS